MERRQALRKPVKIPVKYQLDNVVHGVLTQDLSVGGLCFIANHFLAKSLKIPMTIAFDFSEYPVKLMTSVAWVASMPYGEQYKIGIQFQGMQYSHRNQIEELVNQD